MIILEKNILIFILSFLFSFKGTKIAIKAAHHFGILDIPDGNLKVHKEPIPYLGGLSIYLSFLITLSIIIEFDQKILSLLLGGTLVMLLGLLDDLKAVKPYIKILGQLLAVSVLLKSDVLIKIHFLPLWINIILTILWVLTITNALNIIDIMDGLASGVSCISISSLIVISYLNQEYFISEASSALLGAAFGFLIHNYPPAKIYLGDSGSLFLGFMLASLTMIASYSDKNPLALLSPIVLLGIPLFDLAYVVILRIIKKKSPFRGSKDHFAVRMRIAGIPINRIVNISYFLALALAAAGILNIYFSPHQSLFLYSFLFLFFIIFGLFLSKIKVD